MRSSWTLVKWDLPGGWVSPAHSDQHPRSPERRQHMQVEEHIICTFSWMRLEQRSECGSADDPVRWLLSLWLIPALSHWRLQSSVWILLFHASIHALISPSNMLTNVFNHMLTVEGASAVSICYSNSGYQLTVFLWFNHRWSRPGPLTVQAPLTSLLKQQKELWWLFLMTEKQERWK